MMSLKLDIDRTVQVTHYVVRGQLCAIHRSAGFETRRCAVIICPPAGRDYLSLYRSNFELANLLAQNGFDALRFDLRGTGDSCDIEPGTDQWSDWLQGVVDIAAFARAALGAEQICLAGFRAGGLLAASAAEATGAQHLILMASYARGLVWLRELHLEAAIRGDDFGKNGEYVGVRLSSRSEQTICDVVVAALPPLLKGVFVAAPDHKWWSGRLKHEANHIQGFPGWNSLFKDSHINEPPWEVFHTITDWLIRQYDTLGQRARAVPGQAETRIVGDEWVEEPNVFGRGLRGILTVPRKLHSTTVIIFGNTSGDPRSGASGCCTAIARELARLGLAAFRFDFSGFGESSSTLEARPHVYETNRVGEFEEAAQLLALRGYVNCVLAGICSGGFHAVDAALSNSRFAGAITFNSWIYWRSGPLDVAAQAYAMRSDQMRSHSSRKTLKTLPRKLAGRLAAGWKIVSSWRRNVRRQLFHQRLRGGAKRGVRLLLVFGRRDRALDGLWADFGPAGWLIRRQQGFSVKVVEGLDHSLMLARSHAIAVREIYAFVQTLEFRTGAETSRRRC